MDFVERIDLLLKEKNLKRSALCEAVEIDSTSISVWKKRGTIPSGDVCVKIAKYLNVDAEYLITGQKKEPEQVQLQTDNSFFLQTLSTLQNDIDKSFQTAIDALKK
ncbi:helix-turn-helix domain-containing protein [Treponema berlinense]|uniref:helix-turn-helix domain-containing protein n=1 Tax=Treponema berlinense TaxID=225004 RepID=UPI003FD8EB22